MNPFIFFFWKFAVWVHLFYSIYNVDMPSYWKFTVAADLPFVTAAWKGTIVLLLNSSQYFSMAFVSVCLLAVTGTWKMLGRVRFQIWRFNQITWFLLYTYGLKLIRCNNLMLMSWVKGRGISVRWFGSFHRKRKRRYPRLMISCLAFHVFIYYIRNKLV